MDASNFVRLGGCTMTGQKGPFLCAISHDLEHEDVETWADKILVDVGTLPRNGGRPADLYVYGCSDAFACKRITENVGTCCNWGI